MIEPATVSVILPIYNVGDYLPECLGSVFSQDYPSLEIVAVNDGSTDDSRSILERFRECGRPIRVIDQPNRGLSAARNAGLDAATGEFVMFVDADDRLASSAVWKCMELAQAEHLDAITFNAEPFSRDSFGFNNDRDQFKKKIGEGSYTGEELFEKLLSENAVWVCTPFFVFRREFLNRAGLRFCEGLVHEDIEFTPRALLKADRIGVLREPLYFYRRHRQGAITTQITQDASDRQQLEICARLYSTSATVDYSPRARNLMEDFLVCRYQMLLAGTTRSGKQAGLRRKAAFRILRSLFTKQRLRRRITLKRRREMITEHLLPEAKPLLAFLSNNVVGPVRRTFRYQVLPRLRRLRD